MNQLDLHGRVAVVTGGAQGIGLAIAQRLLASGAAVALWDRNAQQLEHASGALASTSARARITTHEVDVTDESSVAAATAATQAAHQRIDALVNSAGITGGNAPTWELAPQVWREVLEVNLTGCYLTCRSVVPIMVQAGWGRIVNIASVAGKDGNPNAAHYSASKAGLIALTKSLGKELAKSGVLVNAVTPAAARTAIFETMTQQHIDYMLSKIPMGRFLEVDEAAAMVGWLCSEDCAFSTAAVFDLSGGRSTY